MAPPRFEAIASDLELAQTLGPETFGALLTLALLAAPQTDVPSGWAVGGTMEDVASILGVSKPTALKVVRDLEAYRLIYRQMGRKLGKNVGTLPGRIWLTYDPLLPHPNKPLETTFIPTNILPVKSLSVMAVDNSPTVSSSLVSFSPTQTGAQNTVSFNDNIVSTVMNDDIHSSFQNNDKNISTATTERPLDQQPAPVRNALSKLGWNGDVPDIAPEVLTALALWVGRQPLGRFKKSGAAWLRAVIEKPGEAVRLCSELGLLSQSQYFAEEIVNLSDPSLPVMAKHEYDERCINDPAWEAAIDVEAMRRASEQRVRVTMLLKRTIAAQWYEQEQRGEAVYGERFG